MKHIAVILRVALAAVGLGAGAQAPESAPAPPADSSSARGSVSTPGGEVRGQVTNDRNGSSRPAEDGSALPRTAVTEHTTLFGLSPTAAVLIAAALLVVVIVAIVAMTRSA